MVKIKHQFIGTYELITGMFGGIIVLANTGRVTEDHSLMVSLVIGIMLYSGLALSGYWLIKRGSEVARFSVWLQVLQIAGFTFNGAQYLFTSSAFLYIFIRGGIHVHVDSRIVNFNFSQVPDFISNEIQIYLLPVLFIILLLVNKRTGAEEK
jgi:hypothetical protein